MIESDCDVTFIPFDIPGALLFDLRCPASLAHYVLQFLDISTTLYTIRSLNHNHHSSSLWKDDMWWKRRLSCEFGIDTSVDREVMKQNLTFWMDMDPLGRRACNLITAHTEEVTLYQERSLNTWVKPEDREWFLSLRGGEVFNEAYDVPRRLMHLLSDSDPWDVVEQRRQDARARVEADPLWFTAAIHLTTRINWYTKIAYTYAYDLGDDDYVCDSDDLSRSD